MSLIQEINRTETNKNKTKQVAINIDNKLVELGGEQAVNLADVPNKIEGVTKQYKKFYKAKFTFEGYLNSGGYTFNLNPGFTIEKLWIYTELFNDSYYPIQDLETASGTNIQQALWSNGGGQMQLKSKLTKVSNTKWVLSTPNSNNTMFCRDFTIYAIGV